MDTTSLFEVCGRIYRNKGRGRQLGFPTANMSCPAGIVDGVFIAHAQCQKNDAWLPALLFVGIAHTFGDTQRSCETHILDFSDNLDGTVLVVRALRKLRDVKKYSKKQELIEAIQEDERIARAFFSAIKQ